MQKPAGTRSSMSPSTRPNPGRRSTRAPSKGRRNSRTSLETNPEQGSNDEDSSFEMDKDQLMQLEKELYPGAKTWARDEERLFEILFMRQDLAMLPRGWEFDLSGVPISDGIFDTSEQCPPTIYAHSRRYKATAALMRLIDLTANVRAAIQSGLRDKVPGLIKTELDKYLNWAAQDGGYHHLRTVPNIVTEIIGNTMTDDEKATGDEKVTSDDIATLMQARMRTLARLQREFFRVDRDTQFWEVIKPKLLHSPKIKIEDEGSPPSLASLASPPRKRKHDESGHQPDELSTDVSNLDANGAKVEIGTKRRPFQSPSKTNATDFDELSEDYESNQRPRKKLKVSSPLKKCEAVKQTPTRPLRYRRTPPVVYGLCILNTSVFLLTMDSAKGEDAYISFHVDTDFSDNHQGVWNALTIAIAVCMARDELRTRMDDFEPIPVEVESDPDA